MSQEPPASVKAAVGLTVALLVLTAATGVLTIVFKDEVDDAWAVAHADGGSVEVPAIVPVAVVMLVVVALLAVVLLEFFRARHRWARGALTATVALMALGALATLRIDPPALFAALSVVSLLLDAAIVVALWQRSTSAYLRAPVAGDVATRP